MLYHYNVVMILLCCVGINTILFAKVPAPRRLSKRVKKGDAIHAQAVNSPAPQDALTVPTIVADSSPRSENVPLLPSQPKTESQDIVNGDAAQVRDAGGDHNEKRDSTLALSQKTKSCQIRVLIDEAFAEESNRMWRISAKGGGILIDETGKHPAMTFESDITTISYKAGAWYVGSKQLTFDRVLIRPHEGSIMCDGVAYYGSLYLFIDHKMQKALLINCLDLEDYVYSVLCPEGYPGWPLEMNKVLAIAIRTYAAEMIYKQAGKGRPYHIRNTIIHQVYGGKPCSLQLRRAVDETRGMILTYDDKPIIAMYHICCGGVVPSLTHGINFKEAPYLARTKPCTYCKECKDYHWKVSLKRTELERIMKSQFPRLGRLRHVRIARKEKSGIVKEVEVVGRGGVFRLSGKNIYAMLKGAHSACFTIEEVGNTFVFKGRGYGHHMGMCQLGACKMVKQGHNFKQVLCFYYPGTRFMKIKDRVGPAQVA